MSITMNIMTHNFFYREQLLLLILFFDNEDTLKGHHCTWHGAYNMDEKKKKINVKKNCILLPQ